MKVRARLLSATVMALSAAALVVSPAGAQLYDVDNYSAVNVPVNIGGTITVGPVMVTYSIVANATACTYFSADSNDNGVPEAGLAGSGCPSGGGTYSQIACGTGTLNGFMNFTSPTGDMDSFTYSGAVVAGLFVVSGTIPRTGVALGLVIPALGQTCAGGITQLSLTGTFLGV